ncbi:MAG TPA: flippase-like domain-containing protein, partial [Roseiarcus sp.]|nr:flippase-like domain-containing protein [Roseiarcus sp.]
GLIFSTGVAPVEGAFEAAGFGVAGVCLLRGVAVACAGLGWFVLFPPAVRPNALTCVLIRFLREGANALLPMTQVGGEVIGARALILRGFPASLSAASLVVDVLVQAVTQFLFAALGVAMLASAARSSAVGGTVAAVVAVAAPALGGFYFVQQPPGLRLVKTVLARVAGKRAWLSFGAIEALYSQLRSIYGNRSGLIAAFAIHSAIWLFGALEVLLILIAMGLPASYPEALIIESLLQAIRGAAFAIPGALGAQEGGLIAICALFGLPAEAAIAMSLIKRVPDVVFGVPSLLGWQMLEGWTLFAVDDPRIPAGGGWQWLRHPLPASVRSTATPLAQAPPRSPLK